MITPKQFYDVGERLTKALVSGDFILYQRVMDLPLTINPINGTGYTIRTVDALREDFDLYHQVITLHHVIDIYRQIRQIRMDSDHRAAVTCQVELLSHSGRLVDPIESVLHVRQGQDGWRLFRIDSSMGHINWTLKRTTITPDGKFQTDEPQSDDTKEG